MHKAGFVSIVGKPNVGKSTLLNAMVGTKISIVTPKAQTTRKSILGIINKENYQIILCDTPGILEPKYRLHEIMLQTIKQSIRENDLVLLLLAANEPLGKEIELIKNIKIPIIVAINKIDISNPEQVANLRQAVEKEITPTEFIIISALRNFHIQQLEELIVKHLPEGPAYFEKDQITDRPVRFLVAEIIREKIFQQFQKEIPYSTEVQVTQFQEKQNIIYIDAEIHVERNSQKIILIGKKGAAIQKVGIAARKEIEQLLQKKVYLNLYVRVAENWKNKDFYMRQFGYKE
ncbi:MAG: GTPase Era [Bacteroidia bacterium]|nr:GTPase Era [Bacteroidia bacterium]MDW8158120.1 GTPase Era [Bacteroidia bacterium]